MPPHGEDLKIVSVHSRPEERLSDAYLVRHIHSIKSLEAGSLTILRPDQKVHVRAELAIYDIDETTFEGSIEIHDGPQGKWAYAVRTVLGQHGIPVPSDWVDVWNQRFRPHTGTADHLVALGLLRELQQTCPLSAILGVGVQEIDAGMLHALETRLPYLWHMIGLVPGVVDLLDSGCVNASCTASPERFVRPGLEHFGIHSKFDFHVFDAVKRRLDLSYSKQPIQDVCKITGVEPANAIMFGDSISDEGAAWLAGTGVTIIRLPSHLQNQVGRGAEIAKFCVSMDALRERHAAESPDRPPAVVLIHEYDQVELGQHRGAASAVLVE